MARLGQRVAAIGKIHHALADGVASANLMALATDWAASGADTPGIYVTDPAPTTTELLSVAARDHLRQLVELPSALRQGVTGIARLRRRARERERHPQLARVLHPPKTFINHKVSPRRTFATATIAFADVKATAKELGVTINDLVLATTAGALRELLVRCVEAIMKFVAAERRTPSTLSLCARRGDARRLTITVSCASMSVAVGGWMGTG